MTTLYSCKTEIGHDDFDGWRITKFVDGEVESSYRINDQGCECPAGVRPTCRHRQMLPQMRAHGIVNTPWFFNFDEGGTIVDFNNVPKRLYDAIVEPEIRGPDYVRSLDEYEREVNAKDITPTNSPPVEAEAPLAKPIIGNPEDQLDRMMGASADQWEKLNRRMASWRRI